VSQSTGIHCIRHSVTLAAAESGSRLLALTSHHFSPQGVTALGLLAESHISIHTWPEKGYGAADVFTCGSQCDPQRACRLIAKKLQSGHHALSIFHRGPESKFTNRVCEGCLDERRSLCPSQQPSYG
jgi:S-adenosylmethionine decarboxylase proenzyme